MTTIRSIIDYRGPNVLRSELSATNHIKVRIKLKADEVAEMLRERATLSGGYALDDDMQRRSDQAEPRSNDHLRGRDGYPIIDDAAFVEGIITQPPIGPVQTDPARVPAGYSTIRCQRSGNPPNTDTVPVGQPCTCIACTIDRCSAGAPFVLDAKDMERGGLYSEPLAAIGPVQSGTLREVKPL